jgi:hypothetical protein
MLFQGPGLLSFLFAALIFCAVSATALPDDCPPCRNDGNPAPGLR